MSTHPGRSDQTDLATRFSMRNTGRDPKACPKPADDINMAEVKIRHAAKEEPSQSMSLIALSQRSKLPLDRSRRTRNLPIRAGHDQIGGTNLASSPNLAIRVRNDSTSTAPSKANNPSLRLRAKQKQAIAAEVKRTTHLAEENSGPTDAEIEAALDEAQDLLGCPKRKAPTEEAPPTEEVPPPAKKVRHDKMDAWLHAADSRADVLSRRIRSHLGLLAANACSDGMFSHPEPFTEGSIPPFLLEEARSDTDSITSFDLRDE
ncbi:hypothetical protein MBLNU457_2043t1 [Dothideomycetes sp. NU457]